MPDPKWFRLNEIELTDLRVKRSLKKEDVGYDQK